MIKAYLLYMNHQDAPPVLCPRTSKHLAPLDGGYRDRSVLSRLQRPLLPQPISNLPASSVCKQRRERFSRLSLEGARDPQRGSEESALSSRSSESSLDLNEKEVEREENVPLKEQMFSTLQRSLPNTW